LISFPFQSLFDRPLDMRELPLQTYDIKLRLDKDKLQPGVDNVRYDVYLSPAFKRSAARTALYLIAKETQLEDFLGLDALAWIEEREQFKRFCFGLMEDAINKSKQDCGVQIDFLAQVAVTKMILDEFRVQFEYILGYKKALDTGIKIKEKLSAIQQNKNRILLSVGQELFQFLVEVQRKELKPMREAIYGRQYIIPDEVFTNPMLHAENIKDDYFLIENYILQGHRLEDPDRYNKLLDQIKILLKQLIQQGTKSQETGLQQQVDSAQLAENWEEKKSEEDDKVIDGWIKSTDNADMLFGFLESKKLYRSEKNERKKALEHKQRAVLQKRVLNFFYYDLSKSGFVSKMAASYKVGLIYRQYCPPLKPQQILRYLTFPKARKSIAGQLKRLESGYQKKFSLTPLNKAVRDLKKRNTKKKKQLLIRYLEAFFRFHRDTENLELITSAMDKVNLVTKKRIARLSRENTTLYEFILPEERKRKQNQIINHVIIKADVRGSTDITHHIMKEKRLNPASYFSMNIFDPIAESLEEYGATKVFIEGDAMILSIYEHKDTPQDWYCVARACGLAVEIIEVIRQYNIKSNKIHLPELELGIGICYENNAPAFLFDGEKKIMISPAINLADRLSGCSRPLRKMDCLKKTVYNLYVFQPAGEETASDSIDDVSLRYNVNGIELNPAGFRKLRHEIDLKYMKAYDNVPQREKIRFFTGKYPTARGRYEHLVIRQQLIPVVDYSAKNLKIIRPTKQKYYNVITDPGIIKRVRDKAAIPDDRPGHL